MTDRPRSRETGNDDTTAYEHESTTGIPRWIKVVAIVVAVVAVLVLVMLLINGGGDGGHGPSRHG
jgi:hypothetical protein